ncbi:hypothetical protein MIN45_P0971 [Methylomarinovum tepidoasis]|uniref:Uncharacterized protein n=1 Tax=Methylomarinovum tepidoasis TaxID=2840183 RepID=A0AAU9C516_9GAMM|nr:hypothetical protein [Methylomarinovum sp. IN45]BCX88602.1 hypothetical protein MIN45_P0971 [Methylomarinovum sp. IN45]
MNIMQSLRTFFKVKRPMLFFGITGFSLSGVSLAATPTENEAVRVGLTKNIERIGIKTAAKTFIIERVQDPAHTIPPPFDKTSWPCPPYYIQPIRAGGDDVVVLDVRLPLWRERGTLPLALNLSLTRFQQQPPPLVERHFGTRRRLSPPSASSGTGAACSPGCPSG